MTITITTGENLIYNSYMVMAVARQVAVHIQSLANKGEDFSRPCERIINLGGVMGIVTLEIE